MKKLLFVFAIAVMSAAVVEAATIVADPTESSVTFEEKVKISPNELPAPVKTTIDQNFKDWEISAAYMYTETKQYEVEFTQDGQNKTVKFDKDGKVIQ